jgi:hypothetical protein
LFKGGLGEKGGGLQKARDLNWENEISGGDSLQSFTDRLKIG